MILWRISAYVDLLGVGGLRVNGRWHHAGRPIVYLADSPAGAMLEVLVHMEIDPEDFPSTLQLLKVEIPDTVPFGAAFSMPPGWEQNVESTRRQGDAFLESGSALLQQVPSVIMPYTSNYLFNPLHPEAILASISVESFRLDPRLA